MAGEVGAGASPLGAQTPQANRGPRHEEIDPFQAVEELTARDIQWRTIIRVLSLGIEDVQQFLHISLERLNSGTSSRVDPSAPTRACASQTQG